MTKKPSKKIMKSLRTLFDEEEARLAELREGYDQAVESKIMDFCMEKLSWEPEAITKVHTDHLVDWKGELPGEWIVEGDGLKLSPVVEGRKTTFVTAMRAWIKCPACEKEAMTLSYAGNMITLAQLINGEFSGVLDHGCPGPPIDPSIEFPTTAQEMTEVDQLTAMEDFVDLLVSRVVEVFDDREAAENEPY